MGGSKTTTQKYIFFAALERLVDLSAVFKIFLRACLLTVIIIVAFMVSRPVTEAVLWILSTFWAIYGAYIQLWLVQHHSFVVVLCSICGVVVALYAIIVPTILDDSDNESAKRAVITPEKVTNFLANGMFMSLEEPEARTLPAKGMHLQQFTMCYYVNKITKEETQLWHYALIYKFLTDNPQQHAQGGHLLSLNSQFSRFQELVNLDCLLPMLYQEGVLENDAIDRIQNEVMRNEKIMCLLKEVQQNGQERIKQFIISIEKEKEHRGHKDLARILKQGDSALC